jgi:citrate lyase subunit beta/citryl-CoA lyase
MHPSGDDPEETGSLTMRSLLFVPGDSERKLERGSSAQADVLIVDLEDSVSLENKASARRIAADFIAHQRPKSLVYVRVNDLSTGLTGDDIKAVVAPRPDGIMLPKSNAGSDVQHLSLMLRVHEAENGLPDGGIRIIPIITETASALFAGATYAGCSDRLAGLTWGAEDLSASVGASAARDAEGRYADVFRLARAVTIIASAAAEVAAIDTVFVNFRDARALREECLEAERDGFTAKMAIHPDQVPVINLAFTPSAEAVEHAKTVIEAFAAAGNPGVVGLGGQMYDRPHLRRAERLLQRARAADAANRPN